MSATAALDEVGTPPAVQPRTLSDLGLSEIFLLDFLLKHLLRAREATVAELAERTAIAATILESLLQSLRDQRAIEVTRRGALDSQVAYALTDLGRQRASEAVTVSQYCGPAPVTLEQYRTRVQQQALDRVNVGNAQIRAALSDLIVGEELLEHLGAALNSGRSTYLYGPSGSGKTSLAERMLRALGGTIKVPHAIWTGDQIITVFDPVVHRMIERPSIASRGLDRAGRDDRRWVNVERPVAVVGGELTLEALELEFDPVVRTHNAPPQLKANGGLLIIDDLGRQRVTPRELMNRWIVPLDRRVDYLSLASGVRIEVPFDVRVVFSSNLAPEELADPAFVRRIGYKIYVGAMKEPAYRAVVRTACVRHGVTIDDTMIDYLIRRLHMRDQQELLPAFPFDLISKLCDRARYLGVPVHISREQLDWAWQLYFGTGPSPTTDGGAPNAELKS